MSKPKKIIWHRANQPYIIVQKKKDFSNLTSIIPYWELKFTFERIEDAILKWMDLVIRNLVNLKPQKFRKDYEIWEVKTGDRLIPYTSNNKKFNEIRAWKNESKNYISSYLLYNQKFGGIIRHSNYFDDNHYRKGYVNSTLDEKNFLGKNDSYVSDKIFIFNRLMNLYYNKQNELLTELYNSVLKESNFKGKIKKRDNIGKIWTYPYQDVIIFHLQIVLKKNN